MHSPTTPATSAPALGVQHRVPSNCALYGVLTGGLYCLYWFFATAREMSRAGANVPSGWLMLVPVVNLWWFWRWCRGTAAYTRGYVKSGVALTYLLVVPGIQMLSFQTPGRMPGWFLGVQVALGIISLACVSVPILQSTFNRFRRLHLVQTFE